VLSHDPDLSRLTGRADPVSSFSLDELREIDLGGGARFATLAELLAAQPTALLNIDLKDAAAVAAAAEAIRDADAIGRVLVTSFDEKRRGEAMRLLPGVATSASARLVFLALLGAKLGIRPLVRLALRSVDAVQIPERALRLRITTPRMLRAFHRAEVEVHVWTINEAADVRRLVALGVDGIVTDRTDIAARVVR
jgi:glycerophosphoryl diester phosphodiesterase